MSVLQLVAGPDLFTMKSFMNDFVYGVANQVQIKNCVQALFVLL